VARVSIAGTEEFGVIDCRDYTPFGVSLLDHLQRARNRARGCAAGGPRRREAGGAAARVALRGPTAKTPWSSQVL